MTSNFCKFCGSTNLKTIKNPISSIKEKNFKLGVTYDGLIPLGVSASWKKGSETSYNTAFCVTCRNLDATNSTNPTRPLIIPPNYLNKHIVIPHLLCTHLTNNYDDAKIKGTIMSISDNLEKIYNKWSQSGVNPCKYDHVGKKIIIRLKFRVSITCWVIVDSVQDRIYLRLSYGGNKIICP